MTLALHSSSPPTTHCQKCQRLTSGSSLGEKHFLLFGTKPRPPQAPCSLGTGPEWFWIQAWRQELSVFPPPPTPSPPPIPLQVCVHRILTTSVLPRSPRYLCCVSGFSTVKAGGFGERMRSEETLSAKGKRKTQEQGYGGRQEQPSSG